MKTQKKKLNRINIGMKLNKRLAFN